MSGKVARSGPGDASESGTGAPHPASRGSWWATNGFVTALSWMTILPVTVGGIFDRRRGRAVMLALPLVGVVLGAGAFLLLYAAETLADVIILSPLLAGVCGVILMAAGVFSNRMMHLDGLADMADALGSYKPPEGARAVAADPSTGPMGVAAIVMCLLARAAAVASLIHLAAVVKTDAVVLPAGALVRGIGLPETAAWMVPLCAVALEPVVGRIAATTLAHTSRRPFSPHGFGSLVIGTVPTLAVVAWWGSALVLALIVLGWGAGVVVAVCCGATLAWAQHLQRRLDGLNGDALGSAIELISTLYVVLIAVVLTVGVL